MATRERVLEELLIGPAQDGREGTEYLVTTLRYDMGGLNYFSGTRDPRGYFVSVKPITKGGGFTSFVLFSGIKSLVLGAQAFSQKRLDALTVSPDLVEKLKRHVLADLSAKARKSSTSTPERLARLDALLAEIIPAATTAK